MLKATLARCLRLPAVAFVLAACALAGAQWALSGGDCTRTSVGFTPLNDLGSGTYQGIEGGLYPGGSNARPASHDVNADSYARVALLDPDGVPDAATGQVVLLTIGMSNTNAESLAFLPLANADPTKNAGVVLVNGAQGGWDARRVADPTVNSTFWSTIDARLAAAGVTPRQVQVVWLKEAEAGPTQTFPVDAQVLQRDLETIVQIVKSRYPNAQQVYNSSRIYAGYAVTGLNPEPFAYQAGFAVRWMIEKQLADAPLLNFDPTRGALTAPWLAWGPYLWADGLNPRSDGMVWECADFQSDGTHPSSSGSAKVAQALLRFFQTDPIASRWYGDCDTGDPAVSSAPPRVLGVRYGFDQATTAAEVGWESLGPVAGPGTRYDVVAGDLGALRRSASFDAARCTAPSVPDPAIVDPEADPPPGDGVYYLVRGRNGCGIGTYGEPGASAGPRDALDAASPCPN
jgi:lysophospholipase L1-like esterase